MGKSANPTGKGPKVTSQGKVGPIIGSWSLNQGKNKGVSGGNKK